jgi:phage shock protein PspC (stress-responsive transcriptional regulator)
MKKNISINLQGIIFHIEEDGYEQLSQYLAAIKAYFSAYEGHEEITADIEARMAEIFSAKLSPLKQVITSEDVQALIAKMGSVKDFQNLEEEETGYTAANSNPGPGANPNPGPGQATEPNFASENQSTGGPYNHTVPPPRNLHRDEKRKVLGGVAAGIAHYLNLDPLWIRVAFVFLTVVFAIPGGFPAGLVLVTYILCWVSFPKSYDMPETATKKLFRNPDDKKLGGVASGMALYFGLDVSVVRLLFLISFLAGGFGFIAYVILWIVLPEASSITDRVQMQGNPVTLSGIEDSLKTNLRMKDDDGQESAFAKAILLPVRLLSQALNFMARILGPIINFLVAFIRIIAGVLLMIISGAGIFALVLMAATALHLIDGTAFIQTDIPFNMFTSTYPPYGIVAGFFAGIIPCLFLLLLAFGLLLKRFYLRPALGWSLFAIWILSVFVFGLSIAQFQLNFQESGEYVEQKEFDVEAYPTVVLNNARRSNGFRYGATDVAIESYTGNTVKLIQTFRAKGLTETEAIRNAGMISYRSEQKDSVLTLDNSFRYKPNAIWREQDLDIKLLLPEKKNFRVSKEFAWMLSSSAFEGNYNHDDQSRYLWQVKNNRFICQNCPPPDTTGVPAATPGEEVNWDDERTVLASPLRNENEYGNQTRNFNFKNFKEVSVSGAHHVKIRPGNSFSITARGNKDDVQNLEITQDGNDLRIRSKRKGGFRLSFLNQNPVLITIEMPELTELDLSGAVKVDAAGFTTNKFRVTGSGAVESALAIRTKELNLDMTGACVTTLAGSAEEFKIDASGACQVLATNLRAINAEVDLSGACNAGVFVTNQLQADVSGPSQLTYKGKPKSVESDESGMGSVTAE